MAMVPLDAAFAHKKAVRTFHEHSDTLSLCVHGNDHTRQELLATDHESACRALAAQALRRVSAFERRTGLHVSRYVAPPHGVCSEPMARVWARFGMEGICCARPQPWDPRGASAEQPLAGWIPANHVAGGLPRFSRYPLDSLRAEIILRAFLDQPIILAGHHQDVADGLDVLRETARLCRGLGVADWGPCEPIGRQNFSTRRRGSSLDVWSLANLIDVDIPNAVDTLHVRLQAPQGEAMPLVAQVGDRVLPLERRASQLQASSIPVTSGTTTRIRISVDPVLSADREPRGRVNPSAVARRMFAEARDRGASDRVHGAHSRRGWTRAVTASRTLTQCHGFLGVPPTRRLKDASATASIRRPSKFFRLDAVGPSGVEAVPTNQDVLDRARPSAPWSRRQGRRGQLRSDSGSRRASGSLPPAARDLPACTRNDQPLGPVRSVHGGGSRTWRTAPCAIANGARGRRLPNRCG